jgi:ABC-type sugar transport system permease subunit
MPGKTRSQKRESLTGFLLTLPTLLFLLGISIFALFWALTMSFNTDDGVVRGSYTFVGLENYIKVLGNRELYEVLGNTFQYAFLTILIELFLGLTISAALWKSLRGVTLFKLLITMPMMIAPIASGMIWRWVFADRYGVLNYLLSLIGLEGPYWLGTAFGAKAAILVVSVWGSAPFAILVLLSGLSTISKDVIESATIDGANGWQRYWQIIFPFLRPAISIILLIRIADAIKMYDIVHILTEGGPGTATRLLSFHIYERAFNHLKFAESAAGSYIALIIIAIVTLVFNTVVMWRRKDR